MNRPSFRQALLSVAAITIPLIITAIGLILLAQANSTTQLRYEVSRSYERRSLLQLILSQHQDLETGQRGYLLTNEQEFLEPYEAARGGITRAFAQMQALSTSEEQRQGLARLRALSGDKLKFVQQTISFNAHDNRSRAIAMVASGRGKLLMDRIRAEIGGLQAAEARQLARTSERSEAAQEQLRSRAFSLLSFLAILLCVAGLVILRTLKAREGALARLDDVSRRRMAILDAAMDSILILNPSGSIEGINRASTRIFGYDEAALLRRDVGMLFANQPPPGQVAAYLRSMNLTEGHPGHIQEIPGRRQDGTIFPTDVAITAVDLSDGTHFVAVVRDITERKRVERLKSEFVATVSHELRTPLTSIAGSLGLLAGGAGGEVGERAQRLITIAHNNAERLVRLINDILDLEKIDSGRMTFKNQLIDLAAFLAQAAEVNRGFAERYQVRLELEAAEGPAYVWADPDRLMQVLTNLISNAVKFSPAGEAVEIILRPSRTTHRISICDHGPGIDEGFRQRIFSRFAQADSSDSRAKGGTGLGLSIVREIATRLGGSVSFDTEAGKGTHFHVDLPATAQHMSEEQGRILICESDRQTAVDMRESLMKAGFPSDIVHDSAGALAAVRERSYRVILIDSALSQGDGIGLVRSLRELPEGSQTPILMISADSREGLVEAEALPIVDWLQKPFSPDQMLEAVKQALFGQHREGKPRVLHVDDDPDVLRLIATALEDQVEISSVASVREARAALGRKSFDLAILDLGLPDGPGTLLLPDLKAAGPIPVIIFSAQDADEEAAASVQAFLTKSRTSIDHLLVTVDKMWRQSAPQGAQ
ncbi:MAG TPA: ATP-binding protein [Sphingobium sp.]|nr:ATP-binding protein [Sphingobium sp.]